MSPRVHLRDHCLTDRVVFVIVQIAGCCCLCCCVSIWNGT